MKYRLRKPIRVTVDCRKGEYYYINGLDNLTSQHDSYNMPTEIFEQLFVRCDRFWRIKKLLTARIVFHEARWEKAIRERKQNDG